MKFEQEHLNTFFKNLNEEETSIEILNWSKCAKNPVCNSNNTIWSHDRSSVEKKTQIHIAYVSILFNIAP